MSSLKRKLIYVLLLLMLSPLGAEFTKGKITKAENDYFIVTAGSFRRTRSGDLFWVYRVVSGKRIRVGLIKIDQVYYDSSRSSYRFKPPIGYVKVDDHISLARIPAMDNYSVEYLKDAIKSDLKQDRWENLLESCVILLLKEPSSGFARFKTALYFLRYGLYSSAYGNLKEASNFEASLEPYDRISVHNYLGILEFMYSRKKTAMNHLDQVINFKYRQKPEKNIRKVPVLDIDIFDETIVKEEKEAISIHEKLIEKKINLARSVGALLKGFILEKDGYGAFSDLILSNVSVDREVLEESAEVIRYFPAIKPDFIKYIESVLKSKSK